MKVDGRLSPLFTWRSAIASEDGPADVELEVMRAGERALSTVEAKTQRHVALTLSLHMSERGDSCYPGVALLAAEAAIAERSVQRALQALVKGGWLNVAVGAAPNGTNLYTALIPALFFEGGVPGTGAYPVPKEGVPDTPKGVIEDVNVSPTERLSFERIADGWRSNVPPLIAHRDAYLESSKTRTAMRSALKVYDVDAVVSAISAYATCLGSDEYTWTWSAWGLREFFARGLDRFVPEAKPLERFRVRSARDARSLDHIAEI